MAKSDELNATADRVNSGLYCRAKNLLSQRCFLLRKSDSTHKLDVLESSAQTAPSAVVVVVDSQPKSADFNGGAPYYYGDIIRARHLDSARIFSHSTVCTVTTNRNRTVSTTSSTRSLLSTPVRSGIMDGLRVQLRNAGTRLKTPATPNRLRHQQVSRSRESHVSLRGWLHRLEGGALKQWKRRWCVLADYCLFYYKDMAEQKLLGSALLPSFKINPCLPGEGISRKYSFKIEHSNMKTYYFAADTKEIQQQWMSALSMASIMQLNILQQNKRALVGAIENLKQSSAPQQVGSASPAMSSGNNNGAPKLLYAPDGYPLSNMIDDSSSAQLTTSSQQLKYAEVNGLPSAALYTHDHHLQPHLAVASAAGIYSPQQYSQYAHFPAQAYQPQFYSTVGIPPTNGFYSEQPSTYAVLTPNGQVQQQHPQPPTYGIIPPPKPRRAQFYSGQYYPSSTATVGPQFYDAYYEYQSYPALEPQFVCVNNNNNNNSDSASTSGAGSLNVSDATFRLHHPSMMSTLDPTHPVHHHHLDRPRRPHSADFLERAEEDLECEAAFDEQQMPIPQKILPIRPKSSFARYNENQTFISSSAAELYDFPVNFAASTLKATSTTIPTTTVQHPNYTSDDENRLNEIAEQQSQTKSLPASMNVPEVRMHCSRDLVEPGRDELFKASQLFYRRTSSIISDSAVGASTQSSFAHSTDWSESGLPIAPSGAVSHDSLAHVEKKVDEDESFSGAIRFKLGMKVRTYRKPRPESSSSTASSSVVHDPNFKSQDAQAPYYITDLLNEQQRRDLQRKLPSNPLPSLLSRSALDSARQSGTTTLILKSSKAQSNPTHPDSAIVTDHHNLDSTFPTEPSPLPPSDFCSESKSFDNFFGTFRDPPLSDVPVSTSEFGSRRKRRTKRRSKNSSKSENDNASDSELHMRRQQRNRKSSNRRLYASTGDFVGKNREELTLMLLKYRRQQSRLSTSCDALRVAMESEAKMAELDPCHAPEYRARMAEFQRQLEQTEQCVAQKQPIIDRIDSLIKIQETKPEENTVSDENIDNLKRQQNILAVELDRVRGLLTHSTRALEAKAVENAKMEAEMQMARKKLKQVLDTDKAEAELSRSTKLERELTHINQVIDNLHSRRQELNSAIENLKYPEMRASENTSSSTSSSSSSSSSDSNEDDNAVDSAVEHTDLIEQKYRAFLAANTPLIPLYENLSGAPTPPNTTTIFQNLRGDTDEKDAEENDDENDEFFTMNLPKDAQLPVQTQMQGCEFNPQAYLANGSAVDEHLKKIFAFQQQQLQLQQQQQFGSPSARAEIRTVREVKREAERRKHHQAQSAKINALISALPGARAPSTVTNQMASHHFYVDPYRAALIDNRSESPNLAPDLIQSTIH